MDRPEKSELLGRIEKLHKELEKSGGEWDAVFLMDKVNQYYFTGTMQDGLFVLKKDGTHAYFVRRSYERALEECLTGNVYPMRSYKDVKAVLGDGIRIIYAESEVITHAAVERIKKYFDIAEIKPVERTVLKLRSVKSDYELSCIMESAKRHAMLMDNIVPGLLREGMSEVEFMAELYHSMLNLGYHGISRFAMFQTEILAGQMGFGENSLYPTNFDGPGGMKGLCPAAPFVGDRDKLLKKGDLVFVDIGFGYNGYHTDRTQVYMFGKSVPDELMQVHKECMDVQKKVASLLKPGAIPSDIYNSVMNGLDKSFLPNFMGFGERSAKFLGHGVGLQIDEYPIIANGFELPLEKNMIVAVEPKKGVAGFGVVGVEDTYLVTENGGVCITGGQQEIIPVMNI